MNELVYMALVFIAGCALGTLFFGGLWLTIKKMSTTKNPTIIFIVSFVFRMGIVLFGFYFIAATNWQNMLVCLLGFIIARFVIMRITKQSQIRYTIKETRYEP